MRVRVGVDAAASRLGLAYGVRLLHLGVEARELLEQLAVAVELAQVLDRVRLTEALAQHLRPEELHACLAQRRQRRVVSQRGGREPAQHGDAGGDLCARSGPITGRGSACSRHAALGRAAACAASAAPSARPGVDGIPADDRSQFIA